MDVSFLANFIMNNVSNFILIMMVLLCCSLGVFININIKLARMNKRYKKLMTGMDGCNIERILMGHIDEVRETVKKVEALNEENKRIDNLAKQAVQKVGIVKYSAFEDLGGDISFSIALLNYQNDGIVISSIFGRQDSRCYAKPILNATSTYKLTDEEKQAIDEAIKKV